MICFEFFKLRAIKKIDSNKWKTKVIDLVYQKSLGVEGMLKHLEKICKETDEAIEDGFSFIVLSDKNVNEKEIAVSSFLACSSVHHHLVQNQNRTRIGIIVESGEAREVHHHCLLFGYGADAINPYLAYESIWKAKKDGLLDDKKLQSYNDIVEAYKKGSKKGILKVMAKMGISTLQSYKGAQIFEAVGLSDQIINKCFI